MGRLPQLATEQELGGTWISVGPDVHMRCGCKHCDRFRVYESSFDRLNEYLRGRVVTVEFDATGRPRVRL
jgi:hypothetical protein